MIYPNEPIQLKSTYISLDSRQIYDPENTAFVAVRGINHDGHEYMETLYQKGVREFIVEKGSWVGQLPEKASQWINTSIWVVDNSIKTLQQLAHLHRIAFNLPVVGITGSNGKTTCKEWLYNLTKNEFNVVRSPKSFNSQIGVPLSVWAIQSHHTLGIFEAGISKMNEMEQLEPIIHPEYGIFTHFGEAHSQHFETDKIKLTEKLKLFRHSKKLIYRANEETNDWIRLEMQKNNPSCELVTWSTTDPNQSIFVYWKINGTRSQLKFQKKNQSEVFLDLHVELCDEASLENITHCIIQAHLLGLDKAKIELACKAIRPISMRLEIKEGVRNNQLIDDSYNNDMDGLRLALPLFKRYEEKSKVLIISDFIETGQKEGELYSIIVQLIKHHRIDHVIGIGHQLERNKHVFDQISTYTTTEDLIESGDLNSIHDSVILLKGARKFSFEKIVNALETKTHCTQLEINLEAIENNLTYYKSTIGNDTKIMGMVKAHAYGAGAVEIAKVLQTQGIDYLTVAFTDEGVNLRKNGIYTPIMVMNPQIEEFEKIIAYALEPEIYSFSMLDAIDEYCFHHGKNIKIHIKLDTGMKRLGFEPEEIDQLTEKLGQMPHLWVVSVLSHLAASENPKHKEFTENQINQFKHAAKSISTALGHRPLWHIANSAAIQNYPESRLDMVRLGINLYGITGNLIEKKSLENALILKTYISQIKNVKKGESVGYGRLGQFQENGKIATLAIGYADGYNRALGNGVGSFEIHGVLCPTVGNICMDMCMVDVSNIPLVKEGNEAIAFGGKIQLSDLAKSAQTIPYEIMTNISERVKRVYIRD
jgi:Alr-MurF fusion protein